MRGVLGVPAEQTIAATVTSMACQVKLFIRDRVRELVSQDRKRLVEDGFNLDLAYIKSNIIAMGFPASSAGLEGFYRNSLSEIAEFLNSRHGRNILIFNLASRPYNYSVLEGRVVELGWPDHHAPPLEYLYQGVQTAGRWLLDNPGHVVCVHCLAGRGRTGVFISCLLLWLGLASTGQEALNMFAAARDKDGNLNGGVQQQCQLTYVDYYARLLTSVGLHATCPLAPSPPRLLLRKIVITDFLATESLAPLVTVSEAPAQGRWDKVLYSTISSSCQLTVAQAHEAPGQAVCVSAMADTVVQDDFIIRCYDMQQRWFGCGHDSQDTCHSLLWRLQLNTRFVSPHRPVLLTVEYADQVQTSRAKVGSQAVSVELLFGI